MGADVPECFGIHRLTLWWQNLTQGLWAAVIVRSGGGVGGVSDFRGGTKGKEFGEILGERVGGGTHFWTGLR
jgi:hypothetical protein